MKKIAVTTSSFAKENHAPVDMLRKGGFQIIMNERGRKLSKEETFSLCNGCAGIVAGTEIYDKDLLTRLTGLKVISRCGAGMENVDLSAAKELGIQVLNTPSGPTPAVAELAIALILNLLRKVSEMDRGIRTGKWDKKMGNLLSGKRVGIIGFGRIGQKVAGLLKCFGCEISYADIVPKGDIAGFKYMTMEKLLENSDIVSIHVSAGDEILNAKRLRQMKKGAFIINMSRGEVIDEDALFNALKDGHLGGAGLDVFRTEPYNGPLKELDNVILTPHVGSYAFEARIGMEIEAVENLLKNLKGAV